MLRGTVGELLFVQDLLRDLAFTDLAPFPPGGADGVVEVFLGGVHRAVPNLGFAFGDFVELSASGEVELVGTGLDRGAFSLGLRDRAVKDVTDGLQARFGEVLGCFDHADRHGLFLHQHKMIPKKEGSQSRRRCDVMYQ